MNIGKRIGLGFAAPLAILLVVAVLTCWTTYRLIDTAWWVTHTHQVLENLEALLSTLKDAETGQRGYLLTDKDSYLEPYQKAHDAWRKPFDALTTLTKDNKAQQDRLAEMEPLIEGKFTELEKTIELRKKQEKGPQAVDAALEMVKTDAGKKDMDRIRELAQKMRDAETDLLAQRDASAQWSALLAYCTIGGAAVLALVVVASLGYVITRSITRPVARLLDGTQQISQGRLDHRVDIQTKDELASLGDAFNAMTGKLRSNIETEKAGKERIEELLGKEQEARARMEELLGKEQQARARIETLLSTIREAVSQMASASAEVLASTTQQAAGAQEQAAAVTETVATVDEVMQTSEQATKRAKGLGDAVQKTLQVGQAGRKAVEDSITALSRVQEQVETTAENILALAEQAQAIGEITAAVADVAEQTNLLALNAAIEASRAGEHGKGFAVVAGEVKALADQSKKATAQVRQILGEIQKGTNAAVLSTEEVTKGVASAGRVTDQAGQTIKALAETLAEAAQAATQISASAGQQATGMSQIHQAMRNIDEAARQNLAALRQAEQAAQNLNGLGTRLAALSAE